MPRRLELLFFVLISVMSLSIISLPAYANGVCGNGYATAVVNSAQGKTFGGGTINPARTNPNNALDAPNREMFSLGFHQPTPRYIELDFGKLVGPILTVYENSPPLVSELYTDQATWDECGTDDGYPEERAAVYVKVNASDSWELVGYATNKTQELGPHPPEANIHPNKFDLGKCIRYVKIEDASDTNNFCNSGHDGFDVDSVMGSGTLANLCAAQTIDVGYMQVWNDVTNLYVKYLITEPGVCLSETHLHVAGIGDDPIPQTKKGNPIPGKFDYQAEHNCATSHTYQIPLTWSSGDSLSIAAHAVVQTPSAGASRTCADGVFDYLQGTLKSGGSVLAERSDPTKALGEPDSDSEVNFYSLGFDNLATEPVEGTLVLSFPTFISGDLSVYEVTWGSYPTEQAEVYVSRDGADWTYIGTADNTGSTANVRESTLYTGGCVQYVKLVDTTDSGPHNSSADAFDVDAVCASSSCDEETAWGGCYTGEDFPGKNWATYFTYIVE
jgi:hypothetical protein